MTNRVTLKSIDKEIASFTTSRKALERLGHNIAMMIFYHAAPKEVSDDCNGTGDCTRALTLGEAMPKSWGLGLEKWFKDYTPIRLVIKNGKCEYDPEYKKLSQADKLGWWKLEMANENPFHTLEPKKIIDGDQPINLDVLLQMVVKTANRAKKDIDDGKVVADDSAGALLLVEDLMKLSRKKYRSAARGGKVAKPSNDTTKSDTPAKVTNLKAKKVA